MFLVSDESDNFKSSIREIKKMHENGDNIVVISLSLLTTLKLKKQKIECKTPDMYFDKSDSSQLDIKALEFAKNWYKPFETELNYRCIPLGKMLEYDFYFLFVDALRSIEIAKKIIGSDSPDIIFVPQNLKLNEPNTICYETLPKALEYLASTKNIQIKRTKDQFFIIPNFQYSFKLKLKNLISRSAINAVNLYRQHIFLQYHKNKSKIIFCLEVYSYNRISKKLNGNGYLSVKIYPVRTKNEVSKAKNKEIINLFEKQKETKYSDLQLEFEGIKTSFLLDHRFEQIFTSNFIQLIEYIEWAEELIQKFPVDILVSMEDVTPVKRSICRLFEIHNVPSMIIQHGMVSKDMSGFGVMPIEARKQAVWGKASLDWHLERGNGLQEITGNPSFDQILEFKKDFDGIKICQKLGLDVNKNTILITTGRFAGIESKYTIELEEKFIRGVFKSLKSFKSEQIIIKLHPAYQNKYKEIILDIAEEENISITIATNNLWDLLMISDVLITSTSTTGLEAMLFEKPVIIFDSEFQEDSVGYVSSGAAIGVSSQEGLITAINNCLHNENSLKNFRDARKKFIYENNYLQDGKASERLVNLILNMIKDRPSQN